MFFFCVFLLIISGLIGIFGGWTFLMIATSVRLLTVQPPLWLLFVVPD